MNGQSPLRGADAINDEFEVGFNAAFESRWRRAELIGRWVMVLLVAAALAGLLGRGPLSHRTSRTPDGRFAVDFEPVARFGTATQVTFHVAAGDHATPGLVRVFLSSGIVEPMGLQTTLPRPSGTEARDGGMVYDFRVPSEGEALIRLVLKPAAMGLIPLEARADGQVLRWTPFVLP